MTNLELRVLSGLHRGAALPLDCSALLLGSGEECDVVLADRGLAPRHARLAPGMEGWRLEQLDGAVGGEQDGASQAALDMAPGACARLGDVWICLSRPDAAWQAVPEPVAAASEAPAPIAAQVPAAPPAVQARPRGRLKRLVLLPFALVIVLCAATAYAFTARPEGGPAAPDSEASALDVPVKPKAVAAPAPALRGAALRAAFERELADGQMLERFELRLGEERWDMRADLDEEEKERFERMLGRFIAAHRIGFPVDARVVPSAALLPFRIEQVLTGARAGIVTGDGKRLFVGDEYRGTRLISMKDGRLVFAGKRKIEVQW